MSAIQTNGVARPGFPVSARALRLVSDACERLIAWNESRATRAALSKLTDRALTDIGLSREDVARM